LRSEYFGHEQHRRFLTLTEVRKKGLKIEWKNYTGVQPSFLGLRVFGDYDLQKVVPYIDWTAFFLAWELKGPYPAIFQDPQMALKRKSFFKRPRIISKSSLRPSPCAPLRSWDFIRQQRRGRHRIYADEKKDKRLAVFPTLRQQAVIQPQGPFLALSDFVAPRDSGVTDYIGVFAVTAGQGGRSTQRKIEAQKDDYRSILLRALADRLAEAFAEHLHERVRKELWGYAPKESRDIPSMLKGEYTGIRPAPGYPILPDHTQKATLFDLLKVPSHTGIRLTENYAMDPAASICGLYISHPQSRYFSVGKIQKDQVLDFAQRREMPVLEAEKWLAANLGY